MQRMNSLPDLAGELPAEALEVLRHASRAETLQDGKRTVWHIWGDGPALLLLHGGSGSWTHWCRNVRALAASGRKVVVPDMPGFGDSDAATAATDADGVVAPLAAGLHELGGATSWDTVAFSFGALVATLLAQQHPGLVRRLILVAPGGLGIRAARIRLRSPRGIDDPREIEEAHRINLGRLMLHRPESITQAAVQLQTANVRRDRMRGRRLAMTDIVARTLLQLRCPVDVMVGSDDQLYRELPAEFDQVFKAVPGIGEIVRIADAGHWVQYEEAQRFNGELVRLLGK